MTSRCAAFQRSEDRLLIPVGKDLLKRLAGENRSALALSLLRRACRASASCRPGWPPSTISPRSAYARLAGKFIATRPPSDVPPDQPILMYVVTVCVDCSRVLTRQSPAPRYPRSRRAPADRGTTAARRKGVAHFPPHSVAVAGKTVQKHQPGDSPAGRYRQQRWRITGDLPGQQLLEGLRAVGPIDRQLNHRRPCPAPGAGQRLIQRRPVIRAMIRPAEHRRRVAEIHVLRHCK